MDESRNQLTICVTGTRGFPNVQGGVETHCENLYSYLVKQNCRVIVFTRKKYTSQIPKNYKNIELVPISCPTNRYSEAIVHTFKSILRAYSYRPDLIHIHAIGPSLLTPLAKVLGMKIIVTHHGSDYKREKWGPFAKKVLKLGEWMGNTFSDGLITISENIKSELIELYGKGQVTVIPNGVAIPELHCDDTILGDYDLRKRRYILAVGRFVPEKGFEYLLEAFEKFQKEVDFGPKRTRPGHWKLVIVGDADHEDPYSLALKRKAAGIKNLILTGVLTGDALAALYSQAALFVIPSYYEGLPITLLEALSYGLSTIASDIPANMTVELPMERYFKVGDVEALCNKLIKFANAPIGEDEKKQQIQKLVEHYSWDKISRQTHQLYLSVTMKKKYRIF